MALIPETYVADLLVRLGPYRRIGALASDAKTEAMAAELTDRFGKLPAEVENLLRVASLKRACSREAWVENLEAGPKGMVIGLRGNAFAKPVGRVSWLAGKGGKLDSQIRLRPDHKLAIIHDVDMVTRLRGAREMLGSLGRIVGQAKAA